MLTPPEDHVNQPHSYGPAERRIIAILLMSAFVVILNETTMNVARSRIMADFDVGERTAQWLTTGFMLGMAIVIPVTGWLIERFTTRQVFLSAMTLFSLGTLLAAAAPTFSLLLLGRLFQASGTAMILPLLMTTVMQLVPRSERGRVMGTNSLVIAVAPAIGPALSGILLQFGGWRLIFVAMLPIVLTMLVLGALLLRNTAGNRALPLDGWSVALTVLAFGPLVYGLSLIGVSGAPAWEAPAAIGAGLVALRIFIWRQRRLERDGDALLDLRTFSCPGFTVSLTVLGLMMMALFGTVILLPLVLQRAYGLEPLAVGLMLLPGGVTMGILGPVAGRLYDRLGARPLVGPATLVVLMALIALVFLAPGTKWWAVTCAHVGLSVGLAFLFTPLFTMALGALPPWLYSHGSATIGTLQQVAGAAGTAGFVTLFSLTSQRATGSGLGTTEALLAGTKVAFLAAAGVWSLAVIASAFLPAAGDHGDDAEVEAAPH